MYIHPLWDGNFDFDETVTLTLIPTNTYLITPGLDSATLMLTDYQFLTVTNLNQPGLFQPVGLDYDPYTNSLIASVNYDANSGGQPFNFVRLYTNGVSTNLFVQQWSGVSNLNDEVMLTVVKQTAGGFTNGDMFFGSGTSIGWLSADGTRSNLNWCTLTNSAVTNALDLRGGLYVDQTGVWSNQLISVTSDTSNTLSDKGIWRVDAQGHPTLITNIFTRHLEGVVTLTNDVPKWGPWARKTITGDEAAVDESNHSRPLIYSIDTNGSVAKFALDIQPEDFDIIPTNQDLYCVDNRDFSIVKLHRDYFTNYVGDLLITQAGEYDLAHPARLFIVRWDNASTNFVIKTITLPGAYGLFEQVSFAPINLPAQ